MDVHAVVYLLTQLVYYAYAVACGLFVVEAWRVAQSSPRRRRR
jgi:hypothetical protein